MHRAASATSTCPAQNVDSAEVETFFSHGKNFLSSLFSRLPRWFSGKESACQCRRCRRLGFHPWIRKVSWSRKWQPTPVFLPGKSHGQRSLAGYSPWGPKKVKHDLATQKQQQQQQQASHIYSILQFLHLIIKISATWSACFVELLGRASGIIHMKNFLINLF